MIEKIKAWYKKLSNSSQLLVLVISWFVYWTIFKRLFDIVWPDDEPETLRSRVFQGLWMAIWMTALFNWQKLKLLFKKNTSTPKE